MQSRDQRGVVVIELGKFLIEVLGIFVYICESLYRLKIKGKEFIPLIPSISLLLDSRFLLFSPKFC